MVKNIGVKELYNLMQEKPAVYLVDVREPDEHAAFNIGGRLVPLGEIMSVADQIPADEPVVFYCRKGIRSAIAIQRLQARFGFTNLFNLEGGMDAWQKVIKDV